MQFCVLDFGVVPIVRARTAACFYRSLALYQPDQMAGYGGNAAYVEFRARAILDALKVCPEDRLLDIGCGDGTLLRLAGCAAVGTLLTEEEVSVIKRTYSLEVHQATLDRLPFPAASFNKIACNAVFMHLSGEDVPKALDEIARVLARKGCALLGEMHTGPESGNAAYSPVKWLVNCRRTYGLRAIPAGLLQLAWAGISRRRLLMFHNRDFYYSQPAAFTAMCAEHGLRVLSAFPSRTPTGEWASRVDYLVARL